jgi:hypothetical protein
MAYLAISDFKFGVDRRRPQTVGIPGTLWRLENALISRGGDIERAKKFVSTHTLPADTFGLYSLRNQLWVFGSAAAPSMPIGVQYQQLAAPASAAMTRVIDVRGSGGKLYVIAEYDDGNVYHFYDGARITGWDTLAEANSSFAQTADYLANKLNESDVVSAVAVGGDIVLTARTAGTAFTLATSGTDKLSYAQVAAALADLATLDVNLNATASGATIRLAAAVIGTTYQVLNPLGIDAGDTSNPTLTHTEVAANVAAVAEVLAEGFVRVTGGSASAGVNKVTSVRVNSVELLESEVDWVTSNDGTADALETAINAYTATSGYTAVATTNTVAITAAAGTGATPNNYVVATTLGGNVTTVTGNMSGGVTAVVAVQRLDDLVVGGDFPDTADTWGFSTATDSYSVTGAAALASDPTTPSAATATLQANVAAVAEVVATATVEVTGGSAAPGVNRISQITVDGTELLSAAVDWTTSNTATALLLEVAINNFTATSEYSAVADGAEVTISAESGTGADPNGFVVVVTTGGNVSVAKTNMAGGVDEVEAVAQIEQVTIDGASFDAADLWTVTINGTDYKATGRAAGMGTYAFPFKRRVYSTANSLLRYSALNDPDEWVDSDPEATGAGFINISQESEGAQRLVAVAPYDGQGAIFSRENITIYLLDTDAENNSFVQTLENTGTIAPRSVVAYGSTDVFYLDSSGVRSIRARTGTNTAYVSDAGSAIDTFIQDLIAEVGETVAAKAQGIVDPKDGRYMLALGDTVLALSYFPDSKITAWSYLLRETTVDSIVRGERDIYLREGNTIYRYGGAAGTTYPSADEFEAVAETPFMDAKDPATRKLLQGFDMACSGRWLVDVLIDPNDTDNYVRVGYIDKTTYHLPKIELPGQTTHVAFRFTCSDAGYASLSAVAIHYNDEKPAG